MDTVAQAINPAGQPSPSPTITMPAPEVTGLAETVTTAPLVEPSPVADVKRDDRSRAETQTEETKPAPEKKRSEVARSTWLYGGAPARTSLTKPYVSVAPP